MEISILYFNKGTALASGFTSIIVMKNKNDHLFGQYLNLWKEHNIKKQSLDARMPKKDIFNYRDFRYFYNHHLRFDYPLVKKSCNK